MKKPLFVLVLSSWTLLNVFTMPHETGREMKPEFSTTEQSPFNFVAGTPSKLKKGDKADLSFFVNQAIVFQYRLKFEVPKGGEGVVNRSLLNWSEWSTRDINEIKTAQITQEGKYRLVIEYKTHTSGEVLKYEKTFNVYSDKPIVTLTATRPETPVQIKPTNEQAHVQLYESKVVIEHADTLLVTESFAAVNPEDTLQAGNELLPKGNEQDQGSISQPAENKTDSLEISNPHIGEEITVDSNTILIESIANRNPDLILESINHGAGKELKSSYGGSIFHLLDDKIASPELLAALKSKGFTIDKTDDYGNSPLIYAVSTWNNLYAKYLIDLGADLNLRNNQDLSPLHIAVLMNNQEAVSLLLTKGSEVNLKGNTAYTSLHIASEMNHYAIARTLLEKQASVKSKTLQGFTSGEIAKIQGNTDMSKLLSSKGSYKYSDAESGSPAKNSGKYAYPKIDFHLPYDESLIRKRHTAETLQTISVPLFIISAAGAVFLHLEANKFYSKSQKSFDEDIALSYYNKTLRYDTFSYAAGGISIVSLYGFIHSTFWKQSVTNRMRKNF